MRRSRLRYLAPLTALVIVAAACGGDREDSSSTTAAAGGGDTTTTAVTAGATFGDLEWPCGPAEEGTQNTASDVGVTEDTIVIGNGDDRGFPTSPGLNKEMTEAVDAMIAKCNELGGINGRMIEPRFFDAAILSIQQAMTDACDADLFMMVGQGWALDSNQEEIRQGCGLPSIPTYTVSAAHAHAPLQYNGVPNPSDFTPAAVAAQMAELFPEEVKNAGTLAGNFSATQETRDKIMDAYSDFGWEFTGSKIEYNIQGESDWTPFLRQMKEEGTKLVYFSGSCMPNYRKLREAADIEDFEAIWVVDANFYETKCSDANTDGLMDNTYLRFSYVPWDERADNKATDDFLAILEDAGVDPSLLGMQGTSSFLMWAQAADSCGADLTRQCVLDALEGLSDWTAGGLHAATDPGDNMPPECGMILELKGTEYLRVQPEGSASYDCEEGFVAPVSTPAVDAAKLDENRISTLFAG